MIIFLYGEDYFQSSRKLLELKKKFLSSDKSGSGLSVFDIEEEKNIISKIIATLRTANLLAPKRLIIIKNLFSSALSLEEKTILEFLKKNSNELLNDKDRIIIFWEVGMPRKNNALFKFLKEKAKKQQFDNLVGFKLEQSILQILFKIDPKAKIEKEALKELLSVCQNNKYLIFSELQKLVNFSAGEIITLKEIRNLVKNNLKSSIFQAIDAIGANNKKEALNLIYEHLAKGEDPFYLLSMLVYQFRNMLKVSDLAINNQLTEYEIAKVAKLHPFVIKKTLSQIKNFSFSQLKKIYQELSQLDITIKTGEVDIKLALVKFIVEL